MNATSSILVCNEADVRIICQILRVIFWKRSGPRNILLYLFCSLEKLGLFHLKKSVIFLEIGSAMSSTQLACAHSLLWSACEYAATYQRMWSECLFPACCSNLGTDCLAADVSCLFLQMTQCARRWRLCHLWRAWHADKEADCWLS